MTSEATAQSSGAPAVRAVKVSKVYGSGDARVFALRDIDLTIQAQQLTAVMGPSGSGKSTLLHCLAALDTVTTGEIWIGGTLVTGLSDARLTRLRRRQVGFVFQQFNLLPTLTARENILLPMAIAGHKPDPGWFDQVIAAMGLGDRLGHRPAQLSGGQQQRVACARAVLGRPDVIFADEPTGNLDSRAGGEILRLLRDAVHRQGQTVVLVTHDAGAAAYADRVEFLHDGRIVSELFEPTPGRVLERLADLEGTAGSGGRR